MNSADILSEKKESTLILTINRPDVFNALNKESKHKLTEEITKASEDSSIRSIVLTANGKAFCSGQDLNDRSTQGKASDLGHTLETEWNPLIRSIRHNKKIVLCAVNGVTAGAGLSIVLACDLIISPSKTRFVSGFSKIGLAPDAGSSFNLIKHLGYQKTMEFFLFNEQLTGQDFYNQGIVNFLDENPLDKALQLAKSINKMAPRSVEFIKSNLQYSLEETFDESMHKETQAQRSLGQSQDYQEGIQAFFEKRAPEFKGK